MKILKVHKVIHKRHIKQNLMWKLLHKSKMLFCNHNSVEPTERGELSYWSGIEYAECHHCEALLEIRS